MGMLRSTLAGLVPAVLAAFAPAAIADPLSLRSEGGHFMIRVAGLERPQSINQLRGFDLVITTADGRPATGVAIRVDGEREYSPNHLPTSPKVRPMGRAGHYRLEGLRFHMAGRWKLALDLEAAHLRDRVSIDVVVK